jgi:hypothetical protein
MDVTLAMDQWDAPPPDCPNCLLQGNMRQEFKPFAINGSPAAYARAVAEDIAAKDYHVADMGWRKDREVASTTPHRLKDATPASAGVPSNWGAPIASVEQAIAIGRNIRVNHGSGLEMLQNGIKDGTQPDLIKNSVARMKAGGGKIW